MDADPEVVTKILYEIIQGAAEAIERHTGEPADLSQIQAELPFRKPSTL